MKCIKCGMFFWITIPVILFSSSSLCCCPKQTCIVLDMTFIIIIFFLKDLYNFFKTISLLRISYVQHHMTTTILDKHQDITFQKISAHSEQELMLRTSDYHAWFGHYEPKRRRHYLKISCSLRSLRLASAV